MKTKTEIKAIAKAFHVFCNKYVGKLQTSKIEVYPGLVASIDYYIDFNNDDFDIEDMSFKATKAVQVFADALSVDLQQTIWDIEWSERIDVGDLFEQFKDLTQELNEAIYGDETAEYDHYMQDYTDGGLADFYEIVLDQVEEFKGKPKQVKVPLTDDYYAIINKLHGRIHVGCQRIPIEKVRELVKLYDEA